MSILVCPACRQSFGTAEQTAGGSARCPACGYVLRAPTVLAPEQGTPAPASFGAEGPFEFLRPAGASDELGRLGGYRVLRVLGRGGMGVVFLAEDLIGRRFALKVMNPHTAVETSRKRFLREARAAAALPAHAHIIPVHSSGEDNGVPFLVMPLLSGETLDKRLEREGALPTSEAVRIGREIAEGLAVAHGAGLIHRDVKPSNVWLEEPGGCVKLLDFGLAWAAGDEQRTKLTRDGGVVGTPSYMAPEHGMRALDPRSDLFSLGCVLYEMATGRRAFDGEHVLTVLARVANLTPPEPHAVRPAVPLAASGLIMELLAKDPAGRPATAEAVVQRLRAVEAAAAERTVRSAGITAHGIELVLVPKGAFRMGGGAGTAGERVVAITANFQIGVYPVTQGQWQAVMGHNPSWFSRQGRGEDLVKDLSDAELRDFPVEQVSWDEVQEFIRRLNQREDGGWRCRLPTEAEWEYACRGAARLPGGTMSPLECSWDFYFDRPAKMLGAEQANFDGRFPHGGAGAGPYLQRTSRVGQYPPNSLGIHDLHGNVWEWCQDAEDGGSFRVIRGGSWYHPGNRCRAAARARREPSGRYSFLGCRLVRALSGQ
jgi:formylglycine-generating enzyme required for sulfatase activity/tRNA A-37 threonylcarbamoyl transferase component Bud32